jgi:ATP-dependent Lon protease
MQRVLEILPIRERLEHVMMLIETEIDMLQIEKRIRGRVKQQMEKSQREYYLNEQMKAIQKELGDMDDAPNEIADIEKRIARAGMSQEARTKATAEVSKLKLMSPMSAEATVVRNYVDWLLKAPWRKRTRVNHDLPHAETVLEKDHYGLEKVKERILEFIAVRKLAGDRLRAPILCFVGPPGVGKTSLGQSIARALGRKFERMSVGGLHDEAELRGHRRTYIGAMAGRLIQAVRRAGAANPVLMLDEVDKLGRDFRGDPAAALLEVLDPAQNSTFRDNYLDMPFDLSKVLFITTANTLDTLPQPLLDRLEVIRLAGYSEEEKVVIANRYLIPRQLKEAGLTDENVTFPDAGLRKLISSYTREAGLRNLERAIGRLARKAALKFAEGQEDLLEMNPDQITDLLGPESFLPESAQKNLPAGVATGLAWTPSGGDVLYVEAILLPSGKGLTLTGQLGEVMQESAKAAQSYLWAHAEEYGLDAKAFSDMGVHIHVPAGAIPKDGPSAGITAAVALASLYSKKPARNDTAMTGEITLTGRVLPIGGVKEKVLAARRAGLTRVVMPKANAKDLRDLPEHVRKEMEFIFAERIDEVFAATIPDLLPEPAPAH